MPRALVLLMTTVLLAGVAPATAPNPAFAGTATGYGYRSWLRGNPDDVRVGTSAGAMLEGGREDRRAAWAWFLDQAGYGDIVVICSTCTPEYNPYVPSIHAVDSVQTLRITKRRAAFDPFVVESVRTADGVFIAGGDQSDYERIWRNTPVSAAIDALADRGGPIGGISAGLAVMGGFAFTAEKNTIVSRRALLNCFNHKITLQRDMLAIPVLRSVITDSHFSARDRMGRLLTFMARTIRDGWSVNTRGIGVDEATAVLVEGDGSATVVGAGSAWFMRMRSDDVVTCEPGEPLRTRWIKVQVVGDGGTFDVGSWTGNPERTFWVRAAGGALQSTSNLQSPTS
jgi:cyanophycinase